MPKFQYVIKDSSGKTIRDVIDAVSEDALAAQLQNRGYYVISIEQAADNKSSKAKTVPNASLSSSARKFKRKSIKLNDMVIFSRQLATMLESGVPLLRSLDVILSQVESQKLYEILKDIRDDVEQGSSLSAGLAKYPKTFSQFWVSLVEVGEAAGSMPLVLEKLAIHMEESAEFRATVIGALIYPIVLLVICIIAILAFALFVGPKFEEIFASMGAELPGITVFMLGLFNIIKNQFFIIVLAIAAMVFALKKYASTKNGALVLENIFFNTPNFGKIYKLIIVEKFASQMAILINSGVPILYALEITERLVDNITCARIVANIRESVKEGSLLSEPMTESGFFPNMAVQMIKVGEETGELGKMLSHVSRFYKKDVKDFMSSLSTLLEPLMLVFMGAIMGLIVTAMFMPMFNLSQV